MGSIANGMNRVEDLNGHDRTIFRSDFSCDLHLHHRFKIVQLQRYRFPICRDRDVGDFDFIVTDFFWIGNSVVVRTVLF